MNNRNFIVVIEKDEETGMLVGEVAGVPGCHTQGKNMEELMENMKEVIQLCVEEMPEIVSKVPKFVGIQQIEVAV